MLAQLYILSSLLLSFLLLSLSISVSEKSIKEREKPTPFECGFAPVKKARAPFSMRFFITTLIFLIFDMEVAIVLPLGLLSTTMKTHIWYFTAIFVMFILVIGLLHEWKNGALNWV